MRWEPRTAKFTYGTTSLLAERLARPSPHLWCDSMVLYPFSLSSAAPQCATCIGLACLACTRGVMLELAHSGVPVRSLALPSMEPGQPLSNMRHLTALLVAHCPPSRWLNEVAPESM